MARLIYFVKGKLLDKVFSSGEDMIKWGLICLLKYIAPKYILHNILVDITTVNPPTLIIFCSKVKGKPTILIW